MRTGAFARMPPASRTASSGTRATGGAALRLFRCRSALASRRRCRSRRPRLCLQPLKDRADGSTEPGQRVGVFENLVLFQRVDVAVGVIYLNCPGPKKDRPNALAPMLEIQPDLVVQTVGCFGRYDFNGQVRRTAKQVRASPLEALAVQHAQVWHQND